MTRFTKTESFNIDQLLAVELFHAFQLDLNLDNSKINVEFVAKTFATMVDQTFYTLDQVINKAYLSQLKNNFRDTKKDGKFKKKMYDDWNKKLNSETFLMYYDSSADYYGRYNKLNKFGNDEYQKDNFGSPHYL